VSVALNAAAAKGLDVDAITALVTSAAGIDSTRGDEIAVKVVPFDNSRAAEAAAALNESKEVAAAEAQSALIRTGVVTAGVILAILAALFAYARLSRRQNREPLDLHELGEARDALAPPVRPSALQQSTPPVGMEPPAGVATVRTPVMTAAYAATDLDRKRADIDAINAVVYDNVNNGVYKAGFATSQPAYDAAVTGLFETLEALERRLARQRYLIGNTLTEADLRLWTTLARFDAVYTTHFKCDRKRISDYPNLEGLLRDIYQMPGVADTVWMDHIRNHYFRSHKTINPHGVISIGPVLTFDAPHDRDRLGSREIR